VWNAALWRRVFSAKGAVFIGSLGQRPGKIGRSKVER